jgi:hypothetical protein
VEETREHAPVREENKKPASLAKGLHGFFQRLRELNSGSPGRDIFAQLFKCQADDYEVLEHLNLIVRALEKLSKQVEVTSALPDDMKKSTVASLARLKGLLGVSCLPNSFGNIANQVSDADLTALAFLDILIAGEFPAAEVDPEDIVRIRGQIESLLADIGDSSLPQDAKMELKKQFVLALSVLDLVKYFGADGLWMAFGAAAVEVSRKSAVADVEQKGTLKRAAGILGGVFKVLEKAETMSRGVKAIEDLTDRIGILG